MSTSDYGSCPACGKKKTSSNWCPTCHSQLLLEENKDWTSGDVDLDDFIKKTIIDAQKQNARIILMGDFNIQYEKYIKYYRHNSNSLF